jgi:hypothetical protein
LNNHETPLLKKANEGGILRKAPLLFNLRGNVTRCRKAC